MVNRGLFLDRDGVINVNDLTQPKLSGSDLPDTPEDNRRFLLDLGLVKRSPFDLFLAAIAC
jgi:hypothetical protein